LSTGALPQTPLGELTALPRPSSWFRGWGRPWNGKEGGEGEEKGEEGMRGEAGHPQIFRWIEAFG